MPTQAGEVEERFAGPGEARVRYAERGRGRPVVLLHGALTCLEDMLLGPFDALAEEFRVIAVDRAGHGRTPRPRLHGTLRHQGDRILAALLELQVERPIIVGHSRGGAVALSLALRRPEEIAGWFCWALYICRRPGWSTRCSGRARRRASARCST